MRAISLGAVAVGLVLAGTVVAQVPTVSPGPPVQRFTGPTIASDVARPTQFQPSMLNTGSGRFSLRSLLPNFGLPTGSSTLVTSNFGPAGMPPLGVSDGTKYLQAFGFQQIKFK